MNPTSALALEDVQAQPDQRAVAIDHVGIDDLSYPITIADRDGHTQPTVARAALGIALPSHVRGTHMSRFVEALDVHRHSLSAATLPYLLADLTERLDADRAEVALRFPLFLERAAPISGLTSQMGYDGTLAGTIHGDRIEVRVGIRAAVTSLCPCSKEISDYGAHNQRGHVDLEVTATPDATDGGPWLVDLITVAEEAASAPLYPLLKRVDERHVTMQAYDTPAFVEDIVRNAAVALRSDPHVRGFSAAVTNHESIHNHSAVARVRWERPD